uniref:Uncharacterized protein C14orf166B homolog n=1 Tax=Saccoglossus kowalevskii TaxID=10224 RepID=A0ABM0MN99_SACKO|nr:PREDICTED: uncharacterized protein C14orf166B homolog [Saccoglossus kowalevskii]
MLKENCYISELNLSSNKLGSQGARAVGDMLEHNTTLQRINLSANEFKDKDAEPFTQALKVGITTIHNSLYASFQTVTFL